MLILSNYFLSLEIRNLINSGAIQGIDPLRASANSQFAAFVVNVLANSFEQPKSANFTMPLELTKTFALFKSR